MVWLLVFDQPPTEATLISLFGWGLWSGGRKPFLHVGCGFGLPGSSDKSLTFDSWMGTSRFFPEALGFFDQALV